jgi:hypothetical protein
MYSGNGDDIKMIMIMTTMIMMMIIVLIIINLLVVPVQLTYNFCSALTIT